MKLELLEERPISKLLLSEEDLKLPSPLLIDLPSDEYTELRVLLGREYIFDDSLPYVVLPRL